MVFSKGATAFIIESGKAVRMVTVLDRKNDFYIICVERTDEKCSVHADSLFYSEIQAQNVLRRTEEPKFMFENNIAYAENVRT